MLGILCSSRKSLSFLLSQLLLLLALAFPTLAQERVALVIGNAAYDHATQLVNPPNDAADTAAALRRLGFSVTVLNDAGFDAMRRALRDFARAAQSAELAVTYFAGHGVEIGGENYLVPKDAEMRNDRDIQHEALSLRAVMDAAGGARRLGLVILDACRNDPFRRRMTQSAGLTRTVTRGLGRVEPSGNLLVAFAAREGSVADDGSARNSPFTTALLRHIEKPGLEVADLFREVRADVQEATGRRQEPAVYGSLGRERLFLAGLPPQPPAALPLARPAETLPPQAPAALIAVPQPAGPAVDRSWTAMREAGWEAVPRAGHRAPVLSVALSSDGRFLVTGSSDNTARLWDVASGREVRAFTGHSDQVSSVALSSDGRFLVTGSSDSTARWWDVASGREERVTGHTSWVTSVALSSDGHFLVTGSVHQAARLFDVASETHLTSLLPMATVGWLEQIPDGSIRALKGNEDELYSLVRGLEVRSPAQMRAEGWELPQPGTSNAPLAVTR